MAETPRRPTQSPLLRGALAAALILAVFSGLLSGALGAGQAVLKSDPRNDEKRVSVAFYFDWISSQYEGTTEAQTLAQLDFFKWLHDEFGMMLDVYSLDVGNIDDGPYTAGVGRLIPNHYGSMASESFKRQFPNGFRPLVDRAAAFGARLGIWLGPDGFGDTPGQERARIDMLKSFCRDYNFRLFKFDAVAGPLRPEKQGAFIRALAECRRIRPDLIALNERVDLGKAASSVTTDLWEGVETYIDVFSWNETTAPHHRAGAISREVPPGLTRRLEDHGVCLSSCLDYWEDDLVLQAFNRGSVLAPEIYGSPWLLRDDEFPKFARLFNLHRRFRPILVEGQVLHRDRYGPHAVARGDGGTRLLTLRNLTWEPVSYSIRLDETIGLTEAGTVELRRFHPSERILGHYSKGEEVEVEVLPFRSCLLLATVAPCPEIGIEGCSYEVVRDVPGKPVEIKLLGSPGSRTRIRLAAGGRGFLTAMLEDRKVSALVEGKTIGISFPGRPLREAWHRRLSDPKPSPIPPDAEALYEATCFAGDSNALEVRSLRRSGPSRFPQVIRARRAFFEQPMFVNRAIRDSNLFDGNMETYFIARLGGRSLRVDFGEPILIDRFVLRMRDKYEHDINPALHKFEEDSLAEVSADLDTWLPIGKWRGKGTVAVAEILHDRPIRYLRIQGSPRRIAELEGYRSGVKLDRSGWRASNLFHAYGSRPATAAWAASYILKEISAGSYLAIALEGEHGNEGAYAAVRVDGRLLGAPDRAVSYPSNTWEYFNVERESGYTYFVPLKGWMAGRRVDVVILVMAGGRNDFRPRVYLTAHPQPLEALSLRLETRSGN